MLLEVVSDSQTGNHDWSDLCLLLKPVHEGCEPGLVVLVGPLLATDLHLRTAVEVRYAKYFVQ